MESYITKKQSQELQQVLLDRQQELRRRIRDALLKSEDEHYAELAGQVHDLEDASVADLLVDLNYAVVDHFLLELREVEAALRRIREGGYGTCAMCQGPVGLDRLQAYPTAQRCVACQQLYEKTHQHHGNPSL